MLSTTLLAELKEILREDYKEDLQDSEVERVGISLARYFETLNKINIKENYNEKQKLQVAL